MKIKWGKDWISKGLVSSVQVSWLEFLFTLKWAANDDQSPLSDLCSYEKLIFKFRIIPYLRSYSTIGLGLCLFCLIGGNWLLKILSIDCEESSVGTGLKYVGLIAEGFISLPRIRCGGGG